MSEQGAVMRGATNANWLQPGKALGLVQLNVILLGSENE